MLLSGPRAEAAFLIQIALFGITEASVRSVDGVVGLALAADEGPQRPVVVRARRLDDREVGVALAQHAGRDGDAGRAAADDEDLVLSGGHGAPPL